MPSLIHEKTGHILAKDIIHARSFGARLRGLIGKKDFPASKALWIDPCRGGIHTCFMAFAIDVIFVTRLLQVSYIRTHIRPWRLVQVPLFSKTHSVFEWQSHSSSPFPTSLQPGDKLYVGH